MDKLSKNLLITLILIVLFFVNFLPHFNQMPQHVDSWQVVSKADFVLDEKKVTFEEPFSGTILYYPVGSHLSLAVISSITGLDMIFLAQILPAIFFVILGLLLYTLSKLLFKNELAALAVMAFTPLALSNITILGPYYLVPLAWGMLLSLLLFYLFIKEKWLLFSIAFLALLNVHNSSIVFAFIGLALFFIFNKKYWSKVKYLFLIAFASIIIFSFTVGYSRLFPIIKNIFAFEKLEPYINVYLILPIIFIILLALGFYFIFTKENEASKFLIPLFSVLAINAFLYWNWQGFFLVYRRLFTFIFMMLPFFVGYAIYTLADITKKQLKFKSDVMLILFILIVLPMAISTNFQTHKYNLILVDNTEHEFFTKFGKIHPDEYLATDHLQAFALPYYNLKPVQLSPAHGADTLYYKELIPCYRANNAVCFEDFFNKTNFTYLYTRNKINSSYFKPYAEYEGRVIYKYKPK